MGRRVGVKRSDRRYQSDDGQLWDSKFEWEVYDGLTDSGYRVRRCDESDSSAYNTPVKQGRCLECGGDACIQERTYTPDLFVVDGKQGGPDEGTQYYIECKGYFPADKRSLLRAVASQWTSATLCVVFPSVTKLRGTKLTNVGYIHKYMKGTPVGVWNKKTQEIVWYEP